MKVLKIIHKLHHNDEIYEENGWSVCCHSSSGIVNYITSRDKTSGTEFLKLYEQAKDKEEFFKYLILYDQGGLFVRYENEEIPFEGLNTLIEYCNNREIGLLQCPSVVVVGTVHHPQLLSMLLEEPFHPLSSFYKNEKSASVGYKTLVTSLPLGAYLAKIQASTHGNTVRSERTDRSERVDYDVLTPADPEANDDSVRSDEDAFNYRTALTYLLSGVVAGLIVGWVSGKMSH